MEPLKSSARPPLMTSLEEPKLIYIYLSEVQATVGDVRHVRRQAGSQRKGNGQAVSKANDDIPDNITKVGMMFMV
jgi:hypothetical protein